MEWKFYWCEEKKTAILKSEVTEVHFNAVKIRKYFDKHGIECKTVGQFKNMILNGMEVLPKSYYKVKNIKESKSIA